MSKVLVVGGAGYIGSQTVYSLLDNGYDVVVLDNLSNGNPKILPPEVELIQTDLKDKAKLKKLLTKTNFGSVIHFGANPANNNDIWDNQEMYYHNNFLGTLNLAEVLSELNIKNVVFSSTAAVYGLPESLPIKEDQRKEPLNMYGQTKYMAELMWKDFCRLNGFKVTCLRYFNACGADAKLRTGELHDPETHLIPIILDVAGGKRKELTIFGDDYNTKDGSCVRDYIHTQDLAEAHILSLKHMQKQPEGYYDTFNLGTGNGYSNFEIVKTVEEVTGKEVKLIIGPRRPGDWDSAYADNTKAAKILDWTPIHSDLENIIETAWRWFLKSNES